MKYTEKMIWQFVDGDCTEEQQCKFVKDCQDDSDLVVRYKSTLYIHEMLKSTISKVKSSEESIRDQQLVSERQNQDLQN